MNKEDQIKKYMVIARDHLEEAFRLLKQGDVHDAAEKIWASVKSATDALALKYHDTTRPPQGVSWRRFVREAFIKAGLKEEEAEKLADYFLDVRGKLHGEVFYGFFYEDEEHRPLIEKAREYILLIERLIA
jgi:uncharacterized protein (UPF0332 family)